MRKFLQLLYQPYKWLILVPIFALSTALFAALAITLAMVFSPRFGSVVCGTAWARLNAYLTPIRVTVRGRELIDPKRSYVIAVNHQSGYDVFVLYGWLGLDFKWVMKHELRQVPALGISCEKLEHVFIDRTDTESAIRSINAAKERIRGGTSVLFFPEARAARTVGCCRSRRGRSAWRSTSACRSCR